MINNFSKLFMAKIFGIGYIDIMIVMLQLHSSLLDHHLYI